MDELGLTQAQIQQRGGPSPAKVREITSRRTETMSSSKRRDLERAIQWQEGSIDHVLAGGDPLPAPQTIQLIGIPPAGTKPPVMPRNAPTAPVLGQLEKVIGRLPAAPAPMPAGERALLISARNKLVHNRSDLTEEETAVLTKFIENEELNQLHVRIDWLPRAEQLEVSALVNELHVRYMEMEQEAGVTCETEAWDLPERLRANPLPYQGERPDPSMYEQPAKAARPTPAPGHVKRGSAVSSSLVSPELLGGLNDIAVRLDLSEKLDELKLMASVLPASYEKDAGLLRGLDEFVNTAKESATDVVIAHEYPHLQENLDQLSEQISSLVAKAARTWTPPFTSPSPVDQFNEHFGLNQPGREQA